MISWRDEYLQALKNHNKRIDLHGEVIDAYTQLADRTAALEAQKATRSLPSTPIAVQSDSTHVSAAAGTLDQVKSDLAEALRAKGQLQARLKAAENELEKLKAKSISDTEAIRDLSSERMILITKVKDRDEELKGKAKLVEEVQDEMLSLNLQLNIAERDSKKLLNENKDLIDRWMARMGEEADAINNASRYS